MPPSENIYFEGLLCSGFAICTNSFEVIGGKPADLAGIKPRALIKEVNSVEIFTLEDFGQALREALQTENFSLATYEPAGIDDQGISGGINFHFVRTEKS